MVFAVEHVYKLWEFIFKIRVKLIIHFTVAEIAYKNQRVVGIIIAQLRRLSTGKFGDLFSQSRGKGVDF